MKLSLTLRGFGQNAAPTVREFDNVISYETLPGGALKIITNPHVYLFSAEQWVDAEILALGTTQGAGAR